MVIYKVEKVVDKTKRVTAFAFDPVMRRGTNRGGHRGSTEGSHKREYICTVPGGFLDLFDT